MPARDDSVIRGSLIACVIVLVLSLVLNFLLWSASDTAGTEAEQARTSLQSANATVQKQSNQISYMQGVLGVGEVTEAELENLAQSAQGDAAMEKVVTDVNNVLSYFGPEVDPDPSQRNLTALPEYLVGLLRERTSQYNSLAAARQADQARYQADLQVAREAQAAAEELKRQADEEKEALRVAFEQERADMKLRGAELQDMVNRQANQMRQQAEQFTSEINALKRERAELIATVETQRREINNLTNPEFEVAQGQVTYTRPGDRLVMIDLGSRDALRNGIQFGVYDADVSGVTDADPKAMIEVVAVRGDHLAEARVIGDPVVRDPIIPGDKVYSPFWAPGRRVRIAIAGDIDANRDGRANALDTELLTGMIRSAGAEVATVIDAQGAGGASAELDSSIRFLVIGERPEASANATEEQSQREQEAMQRLGNVIDQARQLGITIIPVDKLVGFLRTMDESVTIPLGPTARGTDFQPPRRENVRRSNGDISGLYSNPPERNRGN